MQVSTNTFSEGLVMDFAPETTKNNCLTNALNATLVTMNGNELQLQNDMGNGKVYKAELPAGYVPLGTTELGGIIYIVSYNPLTNKCQVGSFPSPQRIKSSEDEPNQLSNCTISAFDTDKFILSDEIINPGDKFYFTIDEDLSKYEYSEDLINEDIKQLNFLNAAKRFIKIKTAIITNNNKLLYLDIPSDKVLYVQNAKIIQESDSSWSILNTKLSGKLVLVFQKVLFDYSSQVNAYIQTENEQKQFKLILDNIFNSTDRFSPKGLNIGLTLGYLNDNNEKSTLNADLYHYYDIAINTQHKFNAFNLLDPQNYAEEHSDIDDLQQINDIINKINWNNSERNTNLTIIITPVAYNIKLPASYEEGTLFKQQQTIININFDDVNTGAIKLNKYKYSVSFNNGNLEVSIQTSLSKSLEEEELVEKETVTLYELSSSYSVASKYEENYNNSLIIKDLDENSLYVYKLTVQTNKRTTNIYRWLCTNQMYNKYFNDSSIQDYNDITVDLKVTPSINSKISSINTFDTGLYNYEFISSKQESQSTTNHRTFKGTETSTISFQCNTPIRITSQNLGNLENNVITISKEVNTHCTYNIEILYKELSYIDRVLLPMNFITTLNEDNSHFVNLTAADKNTTWLYDSPKGTNISTGNLESIDLNPNKEIYLLNLYKDNNVKFTEDSVKFKNGTYIGLPTESNKLYVMNIESSADRNTVIDYFRRILNTLYYYKKDFNATNMNLYVAESSKVSNPESVQFNIQYDISNIKFSLLTNNMTIEQAMGYFKKSLNITELENLKYTIQSSTTTLETNIDIDKKYYNYGGITPPKIGDKIIILNQNLTSGKAIDGNTSSYDTTKLYYWNDGNINPVKDTPIYLKINEKFVKVDLNYFAIDENYCLIANDQKSNSIKYTSTLLGTDEPQTTSYYGNIEPVCKSS